MISDDHEEKEVQELARKPFLDELADKFNGKISFNGEPSRLAFDDTQHEWVPNGMKG